MDLIDLIVEPRRTISIAVIVLSVALGAVAIIIHPNTVTILGVGVLVLSIISAIITLRLRKWPGAIGAVVTFAVFIGGVYVSLFLGKR